MYFLFLVSDKGSLLEEFQSLGKEAADSGDQNDQESRLLFTEFEREVRIALPGNHLYSHYC